MPAFASALGWSWRRLVFAGMTEWTFRYLVKLIPGHRPLLTAAVALGRNHLQLFLSRKISDKHIFAAGVYAPGQEVFTELNDISEARLLLGRKFGISHAVKGFRYVGTGLGYSLEQALRLDPSQVLFKAVQGTENTGIEIRVLLIPDHILYVFRRVVGQVEF